MSEKVPITPDVKGTEKLCSCNEVTYKDSGQIKENTNSHNARSNCIATKCNEGKDHGNLEKNQITSWQSVTLTVLNSS